METSLLKKIQKSSLKILLPLNSHELYKVIIQEAEALTGAEYGSLFLERNDRLIRVFTTVPLKHRLTPREGGNTYRAFLKGRIKFLENKTVQKFHPEASSIFGQIILLPLSFQDKRIGIITLKSKKVRTHTKKLEESLKVFCSLVTLAIRNVELYESSKSMIQTRDFFMSTAAHELKTPLAAIHAYGQLLQKQLALQKPVTGKWVDSIVSNSYRLQSLIQELFSVSQMNMGVFTYNFKDISILDLLTKVVTDNIVSHKHVITFKHFIKTTIKPIEADADKLNLVFHNILGNAIKHSESNLPITVKLQKRGDNYIVSVIDHGKGISKEDLPHVFEQFYKGNRNDSRGMGLGMYLCKQIIEAHHGEIRISSKENQGTRVDIYLPIE